MEGCSQLTALGLSFLNRRAGHRAFLWHELKDSTSSDRHSAPVGSALALGCLCRLGMLQHCGFINHLAIFSPKFPTSCCLIHGGKQRPLHLCSWGLQQGQPYFVEVTQLVQFTSLWGVPGPPGVFRERKCPLWTPVTVPLACEPSNERGATCRWPPDHSCSSVCTIIL